MNQKTAKPQQVPLDQDSVYTTEQAAAFLSCSVPFLEAARVRGDGPPFSKLGPRLIRYRKSALLAWLAKREVHSTSEEPK